ncbi:MAG: hypothetical protein AAB408_00800 [Patescibacteria group bacterium]
MTALDSKAKNRLKKLVKKIGEGYKADVLGALKDFDSVLDRHDPQKRKSQNKANH